MKDFMIQIGTFMLLGKTLLHFCPSEKYEKYLKLLFGFMIVIQFITPVLSLGKGEVMEEYIENQAAFEKKFETSLAEVEDKWFLYNEEIEKQIEKEQQKAEEMVQEQMNEKESETGQEAGKAEETRNSIRSREINENVETGEDKINETEKTEENMDTETGSVEGYGKEEEDRIEVDKVKIEVSEYE